MKFTKMHGCQNDFVVIDCFNDNASLHDLNALAARICDRRNGVGADGLILVKHSDKAQAFMQIFNADGSEDTMCGNGIRCTAKFVHDHGIIAPDVKHFAIETLGGIKSIDLALRDNQVESVCVDMGIPGLTSELPEAIEVHSMRLKFTGVDTGTAHAVYFLEDNPELRGFMKLPDSDFAAQGVYFERHERFLPDFTTSDFIEILSRGEINMRVYERGCGETMACGTGSTASVWAGFMLGKLDNDVLVHLRGGDLKIKIDTQDKRCFMTGPAVEVFSGEY